MAARSLTAAWSAFHAMSPSSSQRRSKCEPSRQASTVQTRGLPLVSTSAASSPIPKRISPRSGSASCFARSRMASFSGSLPERMVTGS
jgi:hypothetical protein